LRRTTPSSPPFPYTTLFRSRYRPGVWRRLDAEKRCRLRTVAAERSGPEVSIRSDVSAAAARKVGDRRDRRDGRRQPRSHLGAARSEEHTSELQSLAYLVCRL